MPPRAKGPATVGRRVPLALEPSMPAARRVAGYVCGAKPLPFGDVILIEGVEVPGAADWRRLEAWVNARRVRPFYDGDDYVPYADFVASLRDDDDEELEEDVEQVEEPEPGQE
jgi:hypothetical protein